MTDRSGTDGLAAGYGAVVGARLRAVRRQKHLSLQAVEALSGHEFKASVLGAYERGERQISVPRLRRLAVLYEIPVDQLLPDAVRVGADTGSATGAGPVRIDLRALSGARGPEAEAFSRFLSTIQLERGDFNGELITIRASDLRVIAATLGLGEDDMRKTLDSLGLIADA